MGTVAVTVAWGAGQRAALTAQGPGSCPHSPAVPEGTQRAPRSRRCPSTALCGGQAWVTLLSHSPVGERVLSSGCGGPFWHTQSKCQARMSSASSRTGECPVPSFTKIWDRCGLLRGCGAGLGLHHTLSILEMLF